MRSGEAQPLADAEGRELLPSVVRYDSESIDVGWAALAQAVNDPANTVSSVKRLMGRSLADIQQRYPHLPYHFQASDNGLPVLQTATGNKNPIQVSADILCARGAC